MGRLEELKDIQAQKQGKNMLIISDGGPFIEALQAKIAQMKESLASGVSVNNLDELTEVIKQVVPLQKTIDDFMGTMKEFAIPEIPQSIKLEGHEEIASAIRGMKPEVKVLKEDDIYALYKPADADEEQTGLHYYGFLATDGRWFILRDMGDKRKSWRYAVGKSSYQSNWKERDSQDYRYIDEVRL